MTLSLDFPRLETERLILRGPLARDYELLAAFFADRARSWGFGGPMNRNQSWRWFAGMIGHWALHGYGFWTVDTRQGETVGMVGLWNPEGWPEPELGWVMFANGEGCGYAAEAALAARAYAHDTLGLGPLSSNILPGNTRSVALAERLGAVHERDYENVSHGTEMVFRHPLPGGPHA